MAGAEPEESVRHAVVHQAWRDVSFLHWRVDPARIVARLPRDLEPDIIDGSAWVTITPFRVEGFRMLGLPAVPGASEFAETNVRTYVRHRKGSDGLWFLSVDVSSALNVVAGRLLAPYHLAKMGVTVGDGEVSYRCERTGGSATHDIRVRPQDAIGPGVMSDTIASLTGRWRAFSAIGGRTVSVTPVEHQPWQLHFAEVTHFNESMLAAVGIPTPTDDPLAQFSPGVEARLGLPRRV